MQTEQSDNSISEYEQQALDFLSTTNTEIKIEFDRHAKYFDDDSEPRDIYKITLTKSKRSYSFEFGQSIFNSIDLQKFKTDERYKIKIYKTQHPYARSITTQDFQTWERKMLRAKRIEPSAYDILACLEKSEPGTFKDFCDNYGYDNDSIKAKNTYEKVREQYIELTKLFSGHELEQMQEIQ